MSTENDVIEALKSVISSKEDLITHLKAEIERLKSSQIIINPQPQAPLTPSTPPATSPGNPWNPQPFIPWQPSPTTTPWSPNLPWYIITSGTKLTIGDPPGSSITGATAISVDPKGMTTTNKEVPTTLTSGAV